VEQAPRTVKLAGVGPGHSRLGLRPRPPQPSPLTRWGEGVNCWTRVQGTIAPVLRLRRRHSYAVFVGACVDFCPSVSPSDWTLREPQGALHIRFFEKEPGCFLALRAGVRLSGAPLCGWIRLTIVSTECPAMFLSRQFPADVSPAPRSRRSTGTKYVSATRFLPSIFSVRLCPSPVGTQWALGGPFLCANSAPYES
jgi:hypothetical protein